MKNVCVHRNGVCITVPSNASSLCTKLLVSSFFIHESSSYSQSGTCTSVISHIRATALSQNRYSSLTHIPGYRRREILNSLTAPGILPRRLTVNYRYRICCTQSVNLIKLKNSPGGAASEVPSIF
jgi:hypothetical protein